jgi:hypothetical protein
MYVSEKFHKTEGQKVVLHSSSPATPAARLQADMLPNKLHVSAVPQPTFYQKYVNLQQ